MIIDKSTNMPTHIPPRCTSKIDLRCYPEVNDRVKNEADEADTSMTNIILKALSFYWRSSTILKNEVKVAI